LRERAQKAARCANNPFFSFSRGIRDLHEAVTMDVVGSRLPVLSELLKIQGGAGTARWSIKERASGMKKRSPKASPQHKPISG
jgi:hypothetical protein